MLSNEKAGKVYLVGAGPGDPDLLTMRALRILQRAEVVLYDRLVSPEVLALAHPGAELIYSGKNEGEQHETQAWINDQLLAHARRGKLVVRLKGGDPLIFGRGAEEWRLLARHGIDVELVPGLSSALAVPNTAGIPLTFRGLSRAFAVITGHCATEGPIEWRRYAGVDTLVILMGVHRRIGIAAELILAGRQPDEAAAFIERGTTPDERMILTTLGEIAAGAVAVEAPAVFIVGRVVEFSTEFKALQDCAIGLTHHAAIDILDTNMGVGKETDGKDSFCCS